MGYNAIAMCAGVGDCGYHGDYSARAGVIFVVVASVGNKVVFIRRGTSQQGVRVRACAP